MCSTAAAHRWGITRSFVAITHGEEGNSYRDFHHGGTETRREPLTPSGHDNGNAAQRAREGPNAGVRWLMVYGASRMVLEGLETDGFKTTEAQ